MLGSESEPVALHVRTLFRVLLEQQEQKGLAEYGRPLTLDTKIDPLEYGLCELVDAFQYITLALLRRDSGQQPTAGVGAVALMKQQADDYIFEWWRELRNGLTDARLNRIGGALAAFQAVDLLTEDEVELWEHRLREECPGHDGEGGRSWCAYCGDLKPEASDG